MYFLSWLVGNIYIRPDPCIQDLVVVVRRLDDLSDYVSAWVSSHEPFMAVRSLFMAGCCTKDVDRGGTPSPIVILDCPAQGVSIRFEAGFRDRNGAWRYARFALQNKCRQGVGLRRATFKFTRLAGYWLIEEPAWVAWVDAGYHLPITYMAATEHKNGDYEIDVVAPSYPYTEFQIYYDRRRNRIDYVPTPIINPAQADKALCSLKDVMLEHVETAFAKIRALLY